MGKILTLAAFLIIASFKTTAFASVENLKITFSFDNEDRYGYLEESDILNSISSGKDCVKGITVGGSYETPHPGGDKGILLGNGTEYFTIHLNETKVSEMDVVLTLALYGDNPYSSQSIQVKNLFNGSLYGGNVMDVTVSGNELRQYRFDKNDPFEDNLTGISFINLQRLSSPVYIKSIEFIYEKESGDAKQDLSLSFETELLTLTKGTITAIPALNISPASGNIDIRYSVENNDIAVIADGKITGLKAGETILKASFAGNENLNPAEATLPVKVVEKEIPGSSKTDVTITLSNHPYIFGGAIENRPFDYFILIPQPFVKPAKAFDAVEFYAKDNSSLRFIEFDSDNTYDPFMKISAEQSGEYTIVAEIKKHPEYNDVRTEFPIVIERWKGPANLSMTINGEIVTDEENIMVKTGDIIDFKGIDNDEVKLFTKLESTGSGNENDYTSFQEFTSPIKINSGASGKFSYYAQFRNEKSPVRSFNIDNITGVSDIFSDKEATEIYDMTGTKIKPESMSKGIYIIRKGSKIRKAIIR